MTKGSGAQNGVKIASSINGVRDLDRYMQKNESQPPTYTTKINSKLKKDLNISCDTIQVLEENIGCKISDIPQRIFLPIYLLGQEK